MVTAFAGLCAIAAFGQIPPPAPGTNPTNNPPPQGQPGGVNKGPRDASQNTGNQNNQAGDKTTNPDGTQTTGDKGQTPPQGPEIVDDSDATPEQKASAEYSGPAILSRGISASAPMNPKNIKFTPSVGLEYIVNSGLTGIATQGGAISNNYSQGIQLSYGLIGERVYKSDMYSLTFTGNLYHYAQQSGLDGTDNNLAFTWRHHLSRHITLGMRASLQEFNRNNALLSGANLINSGTETNLISATPATEAFDGRVISLSSEANVTWQISARFSVNLSGGSFFTRRASSALYGDTGYQAGGDAAYRISRRTTVGAYYGYTHFDYTGIYGGTDINTVGLTYSIAFNPRTQLVTRVGGSRLETTGLNSVALDPILAVLFGSPSTVEAIYLKNFAPDLNLQIRRQVANMSLSAAYTRGVTPGNGVILTSVRQSAILGLNYKVKRIWNIANSGGYDTLSGFGSTNQKYASVFVGASIYRKVHKDLDLHMRIDFHHYTFDNTGFLRNSFVFSTGVVWSPADMLERLW